MAELKVSIRYANSLLDLISEKNNLEQVAKDMELVQSAITSSSQLKNLLESPVIKLEMKKNILGEIFGGKITEESMNFIKFVVEKNRENLLPGIITKFLEFKDEKLGQINVDVKTSFDFTDEQKEKLKSVLENILNKKTNLNFKVDKTIVGGFVATVGDTVYDASVKHQLELLRKEFLQGSIQLN